MWLVDTANGKRNALKTSTGYYLDSYTRYPWIVCDEDGEGVGLTNHEVTLIALLTPERPGESDLRTVTTEEEYDALPEGSVVAEPDDFALQKGTSGTWCEAFDDRRFTSAEISGTARTVLRYGWTGEQPQPKPAWRIEHDWRNLRVGEYIIDNCGDAGTVTQHPGSTGWITDGGACGIADYAPFIIFPHKAAATPEAIEEAKQARDKEVGE